MGKLYVGIDCAPCGPRPDRYIGSVCELFGVEKNAPDSKFFGAWSWHFDGVTQDSYNTHRMWLKQYFDGLCNGGSIRGAEWGYKDEQNV